MDTVLGRTWYDLLFLRRSRALLSSSPSLTNANRTKFYIDILHGDINYFTENPVLGPQMSRMRGHFNLEGVTYEAKLGKHGLPKLVFHRKSGVPYVFIYVFSVADCR